MNLQVELYSWAKMVSFQPKNFKHFRSVKMKLINQLKLTFKANYMKKQWLKKQKSSPPSWTHTSIRPSRCAAGKNKTLNYDAFYRTLQHLTFCRSTVRRCLGGRRQLLPLPVSPSTGSSTLWSKDDNQSCLRKNSGWRMKTQTTGKQDIR